MVAAIRPPLVVNAGQTQQLQAGDVAGGPTGSGPAVLMTNGNAGALVIGTPVYASAVDTVDKAEANAASTAKVLGLMVPVTTASAATGAVQQAGVLAATTAQWDAVAGTTGGLAFGTKYFLDPATPGKLTATAPTTVGQLVVEVGVGISTTELAVRVQKEILL